MEISSFFFSFELGFFFVTSNTLLCAYLIAKLFGPLFRSLSVCFRHFIARFKRQKNNNKVAKATEHLLIGCDDCHISFCIRFVNNLISF